jgi:hypothetical protein
MADKEKTECYRSVTREATADFPIGTLADLKAECPKPTSEQIGDATAAAGDELEKIATRYCEHGKEKCPNRGSCLPTISGLVVVKEEAFSLVVNLPNPPGGQGKVCYWKVTVKGTISCHCPEG